MGLACSRLRSQLRAQSLDNRIAATPAPQLFSSVRLSIPSSVCPFREGEGYRSHRHHLHVPSILDKMPAPGALILLAAVSASGCLASPAHPDGFALGRAPLAPPYAVVLISCSGLLAFIFLLLTCLCCKRGDVGFKEFENPEGEDCSGEYTPPAEETSSSQSLPDVYILPLAEVSLPMPAPQPSHSDMTTPLGLSRQHLSYLQEIGSGWFGKLTHSPSIAHPLPLAPSPHICQSALPSSLH
ncbi:serine/threonine-protein kinase LMTK3-like [Cynocephalus volans]|uniref:serine/threonine-protein kinase LMTK3-like n=1 Tax=Cynocephalus volans TaxID=110931 RepID=UPI002FC74C61